MNNKSILVVILAGILALITAFVIIKFNNNSEKLQPVLHEEQSIQQHKPEKIIDQEPKEKEETLKEAESDIKPKQELSSKPVSNEKVKKVSYKKTIQKPAQVEAPKLNPIVVKEEFSSVATPEVIQNEGVIQEADSTDIVITKEYKIQTPARYTFK